MFTGLIEEIGIIKAIKPIGGGRRISVEAYKVMDDLKIDDSISLNGTCQTVVSRTDKTFDVEAVEETLSKTSFLKFHPGKKINLERASRLGDRMGGHLVQGHVDCRGKVTDIRKLNTGINLWINYPKEYSKYLVSAGSICIDGVSLTVAQLEDLKFMVSIIPHTWEMTTLCELNTGGEVNLEFDIIGKYIERIMNHNPVKEKSFLEQYIDQPF
jgi:riboflavin synthase